MAAAGFAPEDYDDGPAEVWPENWPSWFLFCEMSGQWRTGFNGPTALDYTALFHRMDRLGLDNDAWNDLFGDLRVIEAAALQQMAANRTD
jgi:hypothetical protein